MSRLSTWVNRSIGVGFGGIAKLAVHGCLWTTVTDPLVAKIVAVIPQLLDYGCGAHL